MTEEKKKAELSTKKAIGTLNKVLKMTEEDQYCPDIIQQIDASIGLLKSAKKNLLYGHLDHCLEMKLKENKEDAVQELIRIFDLSK